MFQMQEIMLTLFYIFFSYNKRVKITVFGLIHRHYVFRVVIKSKKCTHRQSKQAKTAFSQNYTPANVLQNYKNNL